MQNKYYIPQYQKLICIGYVRGYSSMVKEYHQKRDEVFHKLHSPSYSNTPVMGGIGAADECYNKAAELEKIETHLDTRIMHAIEQAKLQIGLDCGEDVRQKLTEAIWECCITGRNFVCEYWGLPMGKTTFYKYRNKFLFDIASILR